MPATARQLQFEADDLAGSVGAYADLEVPGDYEATLVDVDDYDKRAEGKSWGWIFKYEVPAPNGGTVGFNSYLSFSKAARWKLVEVLEAHEVDLSAGITEFDPNSLIDDVIGVHIDFPRDRATDEPTSQYREIRQHFPLVSAPEAPEVI